jgi:HK97 family phage portal protein
LHQEDVCHYKGPSEDGVHGQSVLSYAATTIQAGLAAQDYNRAFYESGGQPSGILTVEGDFSGYVTDENGELTAKTQKDAIREEWDKIHSGAANAHKIAVLDYGMKYQALSISQKDAMFIEQQNQTVEDIARYFMVPLHKLQSGKQSYQSNEQNNIEYVGRLLPRVTQMEEEQTWKLLSLDELAQGLEIRTNMMGLLRADQKSRAEYYRIMHQEGVYSINDILALEDMPKTDGGDEHAISLNFVPLSLWKDLSVKRNGGSPGGETT